MRHVGETKMIQNLLISLPHDELVWMGTKTGELTVKGLYHKLREEIDKSLPNQLPSSSLTTPSKLWNAIWNAQTYPKVKIFLWSACQNAIPTKENLWRRKIVPDPTCPLCKQEVETVEHMLLLCPWARRVWVTTTPQLEITEQNVTRLDRWLLDVIKLPQPASPLELVAATTWCIWKARNNAVFRGVEPDSAETVEAAQFEQRTYNRWSFTGEKRKRRSATASPPTWDPPKEGELKLNIDGSIGEGEKEGTIAGIVRDHTGALIDGFAKAVPAATPAQIEAIALREALNFVQNSKYPEVTIVSDCEDLVEAVSSSTQYCWDS